MTAQQQTLLWYDEKYLRIAPGENNHPLSLLFDEHCRRVVFSNYFFRPITKIFRRAYHYSILNGY